MKVKNLVLVNGDIYEAGNLEIPKELLQNFVKITYEGGKCGYISPDCIASFDEDDTPPKRMMLLK